MATIYSSEQVAKHNSKNDLWVSIHGKVYDLSSYLEDHPGGVAALVEVAGQDATDAFEDLGHGSDARETMERFVVGKLDHDEEDTPKKVQRHISPEPPTAPKKLLSPAVVSVATEVLSMSVMVMAGYEAMRRFGRFAIAHHWSTSTALVSIVPWAAATSLASYLINRSVQRAFPAHVQTKRPLHFKPTQVVAHPREEDYAVLDPRRYVDLPITSIEKLSSNSNKIVVDLPTSKAVLGLPVGQHIAIRTVIDGAPLSRSYTPTSSNKDRGRLELVIKNYDDGKMTGNYLKHVRVGDKLSVSGPRGQMRYRRGLADNVGMIAGGSGITPMFQIIRAICEDPRDNTKIQLIYANQTEEDILLKAELDEFVRKYGDQFSVNYLLSQPSESWRGGRGRCNQELVEKLFATSTNKKNKAMLCGPPGMVTGAKEWLANLGYEHPNAVSKIQDQVFVF